MADADDAWKAEKVASSVCAAVENGLGRLTRERCGEDGRATLAGDIGAMVVACAETWVRTRSHAV